MKEGPGLAERDTENDPRKFVKKFPEIDCKEKRFD
jgi:hypothetical protein